ncbi:MAG: serine hydrolase domain-containing protein [Crocinitomicaceae bacterium]
MNCQSKNDSNTQELSSNTSSFSKKISLENTYAKQIILSCQSDDLKSVDSLVDWVIKVQPGGLFFKEWTIDKIQNLAIRLDSLMDLKPLFFADYFELLEEKPYPIWGANKSFHDSVYLMAFQSAGINSLVIPKEVHNEINSKKYFNKLGKELQINPSYKVSANNPKLEDLEALIKNLQMSTGFLVIDSVGIDSLPYKKIKEGLNFKGLLVTNSLGNHISHLNAGADMVMIPNRKLYNLNGYKQNKNSEVAYRSILNITKSQKIHYQGLSAKALLLGCKLHFQAKATVVFNKTKRILPMRKYRKVSFDKFLKQKITGHKQVLKVPENSHDSLLMKLAFCENVDRTLITFSNKSQYDLLESLPNLLYSPIANVENNKVLEFQIKGKLPINGNLVLDNKRIKGKKEKGRGIPQLPPEFAFINSQTLTNVNDIVSSAIQGKAFPGCQVLAIKDNVLIYNKAFGHTNYQKEIELNQQHIYDLASLTKVLSTTLVAMKLWEDGYFKLSDSLEDYLPDSLLAYIPNGSTIKNITFEELLTHKSGLPAGFPVIKYMRKAADNESRFMTGFCDYQYENYKTEVAEDLFLDITFQDSMWIKLNSLWLDPNKPYKYSDVNMNLLYFVLTRILESNRLIPNKREGENGFEVFLYSQFYKPLGMSTTRYKPLSRFTKNRIVPTENDRFWRKQLLQGHVHDPNAALYGGIAGNAGLFSNATDLGILLNMWQNNGKFEGKQYLKPETIKKFSEAQPGTHRGLGFNKRTLANNAYAMATSADPSSYGHTGFTGTCFWIDPVNKMSYVFLSNRVHPKVSNKIYEFNVRTRVHQVFYDAMLK